VPLTYQKEKIGELLLAPRSPGEALTKPDLRLLENLARQAGVAVYAVRLTADLQRSRERLVAAREEERRRLRRDLLSWPQLTDLWNEQHPGEWSFKDRFGLRRAYLRAEKELAKPWR
jgi:GAF domain-containing protein